MYLDSLTLPRGFAEALAVVRAFLLTGTLASPSGLGLFFEPEQ